MVFDIPLLVSKVLATFQDHGFQIFVVGGCVRDLLMKKPTYDWDFTTDAKPEEIQKIFPDSFYDNLFGTVGIAVEHLIKQYQLTDQDLKGIDKNRPFEITTFRSETTYTDKRHPDKVTWGKTLEQDLQRRDFTVNAMALKIMNYELRIKNQRKNIQNDQIQLIDLYDGQKDLKAKLIRCVGDPDKRFSEDALRMMRAIRIAAELGFMIESETLAAIIRNNQLIKAVSPERIRDELLKIIKSSWPADGIKLLDSSRLLQNIIPELTQTKNIEQAGHHTKDVWNHSLDSLASCPSPDPIIRLATLLHDVGKPVAFRNINGKITFYGHEVVGARIVKNISKRLRLGNDQAELLWLLVRFHMFAYDSKMTDAAIRRFIKRVGKDNINKMMMLRIGDRKGGGSKATSWRLRELQERIGKLMYTPLQVSDLFVDGNDVMKVLGIKPGPKVGVVLNKLFEEVMEDASLNNRKYLLGRIKQL